MLILMMMRYACYTILVDVVRKEVKKKKIC